jgi:hypothetical protein
MFSVSHSAKGLSGLQSTSLSVSTPPPYSLDGQLRLAPAQSSRRRRPDAAPLELAYARQLFQVARTRALHPAEDLLDSLVPVELERGRLGSVAGTVLDDLLCLSCANKQMKKASQLRRICHKQAGKGFK